MSKLERLIEELCPDGVEYRALDSCCEVEDNKRKPIKASQRVSGKTPYYGANNIQDHVEGFTHSGEYILIAEDGSSSLESYSIQYVTGEFWANNHVHVVKGRDEICNRFLYHYFTSFNFVPYLVGGTRAKLNKAELLKLPIPLPPLSVQREIVRILDNFTELTAELTARKKQYEYYRNELLSFGDDVPMVPLGEIATDMYRGAGIKRDEVTEEGTPCVRYGEIYTTYGIWFDTCVSHTQSGSKKFGHGDILFAITGESVEEIAKSCAYMGHETCYAGGDIVVMKHNQNPKYISYALSTADAQAQKSKGKVKSKVVHSSVPALKAITIPLPSLDEQARIVAILDKFDALTTDISIGLPAEIDARQKQYEYYRDKLLTFKEVGA